MRSMLKRKPRKTKKEVQLTSLQDALSVHRDDFYRFLVQSKAEQYLMCLESMRDFKNSYHIYNPTKLKEEAKKITMKYFDDQESQESATIFLKRERYWIIEKIDEGNLTETIFDEVIEDLLEELEFEHLQNYNLSKKKKKQKVTQKTDFIVWSTGECNFNLITPLFVGVFWCSRTLIKKDNLCG